MGKLGNSIADLQSQGMDVRKSLPLVVQEELSKELCKNQKTSCEVRPGKELAFFGILWGENMKQNTERLE